MNIQSWRKTLNDINYLSGCEVCGYIVNPCMKEKLCQGFISSG